MEFKKAMELQQKLLQCHEGLGLACFLQMENFEAMMSRLARPGAFSPEDIANANPPPGTVTIDGVPIQGAKYLELMDATKLALEELTYAFEAGTNRMDVLEALPRVPGVDAKVRQECLDRVLKQVPESGWANYCRGMDHVHSGDYEQANEFLTRACTARPDDALWRTELGNALLNLGDFGTAIQHLTMAVRLDPEFASAWYNLGTASLRVERRDLAMAAYRKFLAIEPYSTSARELMQYFPELTGDSPGQV